MNTQRINWEKRNDEKTGQYFFGLCNLCRMLINWCGLYRVHCCILCGLAYGAGWMELAMNGDFSAWTADDPDGRTVFGESGGDSMFTQVGWEYSSNLFRWYVDHSVSVIV